jgi:hypothetical protein
LRVEIARGRSFASVLVIPRRKTILCEALYGRAGMAEVGAPWPAMGSSPEEKRERGEEATGAASGAGAPWGGAPMEELGGCSSACCSCLTFCTCVKKKATGRRREEREEKEEEKEKKKKGKICKHGNFWKKIKDNL